ncbi:MAG: efflux RND transporter permease subunit, partial [Moorea sp. SIO2B7]|nr:efflux RND transporter permease subunit [Moorena sp. SIO2B7]
MTLSSLGEVSDSFADRQKSAFLNGKPVVAFSVLRSPGSTLVSVEEGVREAVKKLDLPEDVKLSLIFTRADAIRASYQSTIYTLIIGCILTMITVWIFLRDWRVTLITGLALPLSIIPTFWVMKSLDYTLDSMSLLGLALAIGNLVDDAICMIENIDQHLQMGKKPFQAAMDGAREIGLAVVATTATIVAVFLPVAFMGGVPGQFFQPFGVTVSVSTMFSTLVATTMTPMLSAYLLKPKNNNSSRERIAQSQNQNRPQPYRTLLSWALRHKITTLFIAVAFFIASLQLIPFLPKGLTNNGDTGVSTVMIELPPGSRLSDTEAIMQQTTQVLLENKAVESVLAKADEVNSAIAYVNLLPKEERDLSQKQFEQQMREMLPKIPGARIAFRNQGPGGSGKALSLIINSDNPEELNKTAILLEKQMREIPGLVEVTSSLSLVKPEIVIEPDPDRAADLGVSVSAIARTASLALIGDNESNLAKFNLPDRQIPIIVKLDPDKAENIDIIKNLQVPSSNGTLIPITAVADIRLGSGPAEIQRFNRSRQVSLGANLQGISLGDGLAKVKALPGMNPLPDGVFEKPDGGAEIMRDIFSGFLSSLGLGILSIYAILVLLYNNFLYPFGILSALPLSVGGALMGLLVTQKELGLYALIGIVLLMGLVTKNAILLVDFA